MLNNLITLEKLFCSKIAMIVLCLIIGVLHFANAQFSVSSGEDGKYSINVNLQTWLSSGPTFFMANAQQYSTKDGSLKLDKAGSSWGMDGLGSWNAMTYNYTADSRRLTTNVRVYKSLSVAVFTQTFVDSLSSTSTGDAYKVVSGYPSFQVGTNSADVGYLSYGGIFVGFDHTEIGRWSPNIKHLTDGLSSGPLVLFDDIGNVIVISPFSQFMAASFSHDVHENTISWGIMGAVSAIPAGFEYSTIVFYSSKGFNQAMEDWGDVMKTWYHRDTSHRESDVTVNYLGYYTDNGGYYYGVTEPGMNFEETLLGVFDYAHNKSVPYRYLQYDDWFYPTAGPTSYGATVTWDAKPDVFPHGLIYLYNRTQLPVIAHNRYWSDKTTYAVQNGGKFNFVFDKSGNSIPDDQAFWDYLFAYGKSWGLVTYEQDWLNYYIESIAPVQTDPTLGTRWLHQMGEAAIRFGINIQFCMSLPRHVLASLEMPAVTQIRVSEDYTDRSQYQIGLTSLFAHSLGIAPFKDNFWSEEVQPGNKYHLSERNSALQAVVALLSTGPVGPSDRIGYTNVDLLSRLATADGLLLKPSRPLTSINSLVHQWAFGRGGPNGDVRTTYSRISGLDFGVVFAVNLAQPYSLDIEEGSWSRDILPSIVYTSKYFMPSGPDPTLFSRGHPLQLTSCTNYTDMCLFYTSPIFEIWNTRVYLAGEMSKALPMSPKRVKSISVSTADITVELIGSVGEIVEFDTCNIMSSSTSCKTYVCVISKTNIATLSMARGDCM